MFNYFVLILILLCVVYFINKQFIKCNIGVYKTTTELQKEGFNKDNKIVILIFLSSQCHFCKIYKEKTHPILQKFAESEGYELKIVPENDDNFSKYNIQYIPACVILNGKKQKQLSGEISISNIQDTINNM